jgi:hypothetical protein
MFNSKTSIVTSAADGCSKPSSIRPMDNSYRFNMKQKESFMYSNRSSISRGCSLAAAAMAVAAMGMGVGLCGLGTNIASATIIYSDNFSGSATSSLNGQTTTTGGGTWSVYNENTDGTGWMANGSCPLDQGNEGSFAVLPFTPTSGLIYAASASFANISSTIAGSPYMGVFFEIGGNIGSIQDSVFTGAGGYGGDVTWIANSNVGSTNVSGDSGYVPGGGTLSLVLNTTGASWSLTSSYNGIPTGESYTFTTNPDNLIGVGLMSGNYPTGGGATSFELTSTPVPETMSLELLGVGALGLVLIGRKRAIRRCV